MKAAALLEVTGHGNVANGRFPFHLGRQPRPGPAGVGVGLVKAYVTHRFSRIDGMMSSECHLRPVSTVILPVERGRPLSCLGNGPTVRQPQLGTLIALILDEREEFGVG